MSITKAMEEIQKEIDRERGEIKELLAKASGLLIIYALWHGRPPQRKRS